MDGMVEMEKNIESLCDQLQSILDKLQEMKDAVEEISSRCDGSYTDVLESILRSQQNPKIKKKERKAFLVKMINDKMPSFVNVLNEFDLLTDAIGERIEESISNLEDNMDKLEELEELQTELEEKKQELDM